MDKSVGLTPSSDDIAVIESFVISLYSVSCTVTDINQAPQQLFAQSSHTFEYLPPMKAALVEHVKRTTYQAWYVWGQSIIAKQMLPSPRRWGGSNLKPTGYHPGLTPSSRESHTWVDLLRMLQSSSYAAFKLTTLLPCSMYNTAS